MGIFATLGGGGKTSELLYKPLRGQKGGAAARKKNSLPSDKSDKHHQPVPEWEVNKALQTLDTNMSEKLLQVDAKQDSSGYTTEATASDLSAHESNSDQESHKKSTRLAKKKRDPSSEGKNTETPKAKKDKSKRKTKRKRKAPKKSKKSLPQQEAGGMKNPFDAPSASDHPPSENQMSDPLLGQSTAKNPFAYKGVVCLGEDMKVLAEGFKLDRNTMMMLAYYDACCLEDFCLLAEADIADLVKKANEMNRSLPPLQIRKIEVLHEWTHDLTKFQARYPNVPDWMKDVTSGAKNDGPDQQQQAKQLVPADWQMRFEEDLPLLKKRLKAKGSPATSSGVFCGLRAINLVFCGSSD